MAYVVAKRNGTWEARESVRTGKCPRSRTLASIRELTPEVEVKIRGRSSGTIEIEDLRSKALRAGAPVGTEVDRLAARLLRAIEAGERPSHRLRRMLLDELGESPELSHEIERMKMWTGASMEERGEALVDLLGVGDNLPARDFGERVVFPRLRSVS